MTIFIKVSQFLLSISILIVFHEMGHFLTAKLFKTRVEKFYLFFDPWFSLFHFNWKGTEYGIGWLPLGGYVKISGMIDESMDKDQMNNPPQPYEFRSKPAWQRLIIMLGGVTVNILLAIFIYIMLLFVWGEEYLPAKEAKYGIVVDSVAHEMGLRNGDKILALDGQPVEKFNDIMPNLILDNVKTISIIRNNEPQTIAVPKGFIAKVIENNSPIFLSLRIPYEVSAFDQTSTAEKAGMKVNDKLIALNGAPMYYFDEYAENIPKYKNETITISVIRNNDTIDLPIAVPERGKIGVAPHTDISRYFNIDKTSYSFWRAIPAGATKAYFGIGSYIKQLKLIFSPETKAYKSVGGFITFGQIFPDVWNWQAFWSLTAFISIMLAFLNILPIPALDGGHVMFLLYEIISGRKPSDKVLEYAQMAGMIILFSILILANGNDVIKLFK